MIAPIAILSRERFDKVPPRNMGFPFIYATLVGGLPVGEVIRVDYSHSTQTGVLMAAKRAGIGIATRKEPDGRLAIYRTK